MSNNTEVRFATQKDISKIVKIAEITWRATYSDILSGEQLDYMLNKIFDAQNLEQQIQSKKQEFLVISEKKAMVGFASFEPYMIHNSYKVSKLYVLPKHHRKGYGKRLLLEVKKWVRMQGVSQLFLNVNRHNPALHFYKKLGFEMVQEVDIPIGPYWMNDYILVSRL